MTAVAEDYTDLTTLKLHLGIQDSARDDLLSAAITAASRAIDRRTGRRFWRDESASARVLDPYERTVCDPRGTVLLTDDIADASAMVVEVGSGSSWTPITDYETLPDSAEDVPVTGLLFHGGVWGTPRTRVRITAPWGWPAVPTDIELAARLQAGRYYRRKDSPEGVAGSAEWGLVRVPRLDPDVLALLQPYTLHGFG